MRGFGPLRSGKVATVAACLLLLTVTRMQAEDSTILQLRAVIEAQIAGCIEIPKGLKAPYPAVALRLNYRPDGHLDGPPQPDQMPSTKSVDDRWLKAVYLAGAHCGSIADARRYAPHYASWRVLRVTISPVAGRS